MLNNSSALISNQKLMSILLEENMQEATLPTQKVKRPSGVWILTIYAVVVKGMFPIGLMLFV